MRSRDERGHSHAVAGLRYRRPFGLGSGRFVLPLSRSPSGEIVLVQTSTIGSVDDDAVRVGLRRFLRLVSST